MGSNFTVIALIAAYNEVDIIEQVILDLIDQGISVYFMDDGSSDGTLAVVERFRGRGVIATERLIDTIGSTTHSQFQWERILERKAVLAGTLNADWFIHHDADEFRESPWSGDSLREAIQRVDALGYNAIDSVRFDFWPVDDRFRPGDDVRVALQFFEEPAPYNRLQIRCWKKTGERIDLASRGGHEVRFPGRQVFPLPFILRHYAIRSQRHGERKLEERRARYVTEERDRGWHVQYDDVDGRTSLIREASSLTRFDASAIKRDLIAHKIVELAATVAATRSQMLDLEATLDAATKQLEASRSQYGEIAAQLALWIAEADRRTQAVADAKRRLDDMHQSRTWRWTAPARAAYDALRRMVR